MNDALAVRGLQCFGDLPGNRDRFLDRHRAFLDAIGQRWPFDELHDESRRDVAAFETIDRGDVRMVQRGEHLGLALEAGETLRIGRDRFRQNLDRDGALQVGVGGPIHLSHATGAERRGYFIRAEPCPAGQGHEVRILCGREAELHRAPHSSRLYFAATRLTISSIIVAPRRMFSTEMRSLLPWIVPSSPKGMTTGTKP